MVVNGARTLRGLAFWAFAAGLLCVCSDEGTVVRAAPILPATSGASGTVSWNVVDQVIVDRSTLLELRWDLWSGQLVGLRNVVTGTEYLDGSAHAAWSAAVDPTTSDIWSARALPSPPGPPTLLHEVDAHPIDGGGFTFDLVFAESGPALVTQHVKLLPDDPVSHWTTDVSVDPAAPATVISVASPELLGVAVQPGEQLVWPWHEGVLFPQPGTMLHTMQYPSPASMQWLELFTPTEGLYYGVVDASGSYKELRFGYDPALGRDDEPREMAAAFYGYASPATAYTTPEVELGIAPTGGWYWGADRYRAFLARTGMARKLPTVVGELLGWHKGYGKAWAYPQGYTYCDIPPLLMPPDYTARTGISTLLMYGWHYDGLDSYYPDYDFLGKGAASSTCLEGPDLTAAMQALAARPQPDRVMFYINGHIADPASDWFQDPSHAASELMGSDGQPYVEHYLDLLAPDPPGREFRAMCPSAQPWSDQLHDKAMGLRTLAGPGAGAVGIYWDQLEEMPAALCYDRTHGHATPASAFPDGYRAMFQRINQDFSLGGADSEYIFAAEGANDFYSQFIDIAGGMPGRQLGYAPANCGDVGWPCGGAKHAPELGRYTMFARFLGHSNWGSQLGDTDEFARAFLLGDPFKVLEVGYGGTSDPYATANTHAFPRYTNIYRADPEIYFYGTYVDARGLSLSLDSSRVMGTILVGAATDRFAVQLWNETGDDEVVAVSVDLAAIGLASRTVIAFQDLDGVPSPLLGRRGDAVVFDVTVPAHDVKALKVTLE